MKKINFLLFLILTAGVLSNFLISGCGGGGGSTGGVIIDPTATVVAAVTTTPTITTTPVVSVTSTAVVSATVVVTSTTKPTATSAPTAPSVSGKVTGMFSGTAVSGATVTLGDKTTNSDSQGNFSVPGTSGRMVVSNSGYYAYSFPISGTSSPLNVLLVGTADMNNTSYSGYFIGGVSKRWLKIPKFKINENVPAAAAAAIKNIIVNEVSRLTGGFITVSETEILSTTTTEPEQGEVVISMDNAATNSFAELSYSGNEIVAVRIVLRDEDLSLNDYSYRTIRHELGHMVGLNHPFDNLGWDSPDLPISVMNYVNDKKKYSLTYSVFDIQTGTRKYHRAAGNILPDTDPDSVSAKKETKIEKQIFK